MLSPYPNIKCLRLLLHHWARVKGVGYHCRRRIVFVVQWSSHGRFPVLTCMYSTYWLVGGGWSTCSRTCIPYWWSDIPMSEQRCDSSKIIRVHYLVAQKGTCPTTTTLAATKMRYRLIPSLLSPLGHISPPRLTRPSKPKFCRYGPRERVKTG